MYDSLPRETLAELLFYIAEHEEFSSLKRLNTVPQKQFVEALKALAHDLKDSAFTEGKAVQELMSGLSDQAREILDKLPQADRAKLIKGFLA